MENPLNVLGGNLGDLGGDFAKVSQYIPSGPVPFEVENVEYRMIWITEAARKYHRLMKEQPEKIHASLKALAGWYSDKLTPKA